MFKDPEAFEGVMQDGDRLALGFYDLIVTAFKVDGVVVVILFHPQTVHPTMPHPSPRSDSAAAIRPSSGAPIRTHSPPWVRWSTVTEATTEGVRISKGTAEARFGAAVQRA